MMWKFISQIWIYQYKKVGDYVVIVLIISLLINGALFTLCILLGKTVLIQHKIIDEASMLADEILEIKKREYDEEKIKRITNPFRG